MKNNNKQVVTNDERVRSRRICFDLGETCHVKKTRESDCVVGWPSCFELGSHSCELGRGRGHAAVAGTGSGPVENVETVENPEGGPRGDDVGSERGAMDAANWVHLIGLDIAVDQEAGVLLHHRLLENDD